MNKTTTLKHLTFALVLLLSSMVPAKARFEPADNRIACPVMCGDVNIQLKAGVAPTIFTEREPIFAVTKKAPKGISPLLPIICFPEFHKLFKTPWFVGGEIGCGLRDNILGFIEFNYRQADGKNPVFNNINLFDIKVGETTRPITTSLTVRPNKFKAFGAYVGTRLYSDYWCNCISFFVGSKIGLVRHQETCFTFTTATTSPDPSVTTPVTFTSPKSELFLRNTVVSGGVQAGLDWNICNGLNFVVTGEVVATGPSRTNPDIKLKPVTPAIKVSDVIIGRFGTEVSFPVTFGLKWTF